MRQYPSPEEFEAQKRRIAMLQRVVLWGIFAFVLIALAFAVLPYLA